MNKQEFDNHWLKYIPDNMQELYKDELSFVITEAIAEHEASKTVIKAKALRKKGTDKWYQIDYVAFDDGNFPFRTRRLPDLWHDEYRKDGIGFVAEANLPSDAELVDLEIRVIEPNK